LKVVHEVATAASPLKRRIDRLEPFAVATAAAAAAAAAASAFHTVALEAKRCDEQDSK